MEKKISLIARIPWISILLITIPLVLIVIFKSDISARIVSLDSIQKKIAEKDARGNRLIALKADARKAREYRYQLETLLPKSDRTLEVQRSLKTLAKNSELKLTFSFSSETPSTITTPGKIDFQFTATGPFSRVLDFVKRFEEIAFLKRIDSIDISDKTALTDASVRGSFFTQ